MSCTIYVIMTAKWVSATMVSLTRLSVSMVLWLLSLLLLYYTHFLVNRCRFESVLTRMNHYDAGMSANWLLVLDPPLTSVAVDTMTCWCLGLSLWHLCFCCYSIVNSYSLDGILNHYWLLWHRYGRQLIVYFFTSYDFLCVSITVALNTMTSNRLGIVSMVPWHMTVNVDDLRLWLLCVKRICHWVATLTNVPDRLTCFPVFIPMFWQDSDIILTCWHLLTNHGDKIS